jgi:DNA polymerase III delta subunit
MSEITTAVGSKENAAEDIQALARKWYDNPEIIVVTGKDIKHTVSEKVSALFVQENLVLVLLDPEQGLIDEMRGHLEVLREKIRIMVYLTAGLPDPQRPPEGNVVRLEQDKKKRVEERVRAFIRRYEKKMTDQAFQLLKERIRDESVLESELMKLVNYVGDRKEIKSKDVTAVVTETHEETMFTLFDAFLKKDKKDVLSILDNLLANMNIPKEKALLAIQSFLVRQVRLLLQGKDMEEVFKSSSEFAAFSKTLRKWVESIDMKPGDKRQYLPFQKPYYAFKLSKTGQKVSGQMLLRLLDNLAAFDVHVKSGTRFGRVRLEIGLLEG